MIRSAKKITFLSEPQAPFLLFWQKSRSCRSRGVLLRSFSTKSGKIAFPEMSRGPFALHFDQIGKNRVPTKSPGSFALTFAPKASKSGKRAFLRKSRGLFALAFAPIWENERSRGSRRVLLPALSTKMGKRAFPRKSRGPLALTFDQFGKNRVPEEVAGSSCAHFRPIREKSRS